MNVTSNSDCFLNVTLCLKNFLLLAILKLFLRLSTNIFVVRQWPEVTCIKFETHGGDD